MTSLRAILNEPTPPSSPSSHWQRPQTPAHGHDAEDEQGDLMHDSVDHDHANTPSDDSGQGRVRVTNTGTYTPSIFSSLDPFCMTPTGAQKRPSQAIQDRAEVVCKKMCLAPPSATKVHEFIELSVEEQNVTIYGELLKLGDAVNVIQPADAVFRIPELLDKKIEEHIVRVLLRDDLPFYVKKKEDVATVVQKILVKHPDWGLTSKVHDNKVQFDVIMRRISERVNDRRSDVKKAIFQSMYKPPTKADPGAYIPLDQPLTIYELCKVLTEIYPHASVKVSLGMLGRVAILRNVYQENPGRNFWNKVDDDLKTIRDSCRSDRRAISRAVKKILRNDCHVYGPFDLEEFLKAGGSST